MTGNTPVLNEILALSGRHADVPAPDGTSALDVATGRQDEDIVSKLREAGVTDRRNGGAVDRPPVTAVNKRFICSSISINKIL